MQRVLRSLLILAAVVLAVADTAVPQATVVVKEQITITVDRAVVRTDVPPISVQGRTLVPIRSIFEAFQADIDWFPREQRVYIRKNCTVIWLQIGDAHAKVNDNVIPIAVPAMLYRGRTMVPLRFIAETLGATVTWNPSTQTITIVARAQQPATTPPPATTPESASP